MKYLIQTINKKVKHDFSFTLLESIEFQNWLRNDKSFEVCFTDEPTMPNYIPIGSVEFVSKYITDYYGLTLKPKNIPIELIGKNWTGRNVINGTEKDIIGEKFVKSNDRIKSFTEICKTAPKGNYQISDLIDIESEWRAFIFEGKLVGLQNYSGEFDVFPNVDKIKAMINAYKTQPIAFTLDVAISNNDTVIIEVHDFFSCGLYGFSEHKILPFMFSKWFYSFCG
ncbi:MAG: ATP-grasp domain-containing protein [Candidatus Scalindua sp.]|nr:ATP-grasp domain-containing protein [Candidatus Scalindua sp.]